MSGVPCDIDAERNLLGAVIAAPRFLNGVLVDTGLKAEHFYLDKHRQIFEAICGLHDADRAIDPTTINAELRERNLLGTVGEHTAAELFAACPAAGNARSYAEVIVREAEWAVRLEAKMMLDEAITVRDAGKLADAEALLQTDLTREDADLEPDDLREIAFDLLEKGGAEAFPWPFKRLNDLCSGGMRRGEFVVIGGHSSHGKSQLLDQTLTGLHKSGLRIRLYINEMSAQQRVARIVNRKTGIPYSKIIRGALDRVEMKAATAALNEENTFPFGFTLAAGWSALDIAHHIRRNAYDIAAVDIMHLIQYEDERDLSAITATFARTAVQANCVVISTAHLNEKRVTGVVRPRPMLGDLRGSGSIKNDADIVCMVWREQDEETGDPQPQGEIYLPKVRNGPTGGMRAYFKGENLSFTPLAGDDLEPGDLEPDAATAPAFLMNEEGPRF